MSLSRRTFLRDGLRSAASVALLLASTRIGLGQKPSRGQVRVTPNAQPEIPIEAQRDPVFSFVEDTFKPYVNGIFQAPNARGEMIELRLVKVEVHKPKNTVTRRARESKSFSLVFKASGELPPFTSIHTISHPALGEFDLFLTRRKTEEDELYYEAVINHIQ
jgi:hypothetical protein